MTTVHQLKVAPPLPDATDLSSTAPRLSRAQIALIVICVFHALSPLITRGLHAGLGWDETVYISQIDPHVPAGVFTAPRARGMTLLTAPASLVSSSLAVMRVWLALLSAVGLFVALIPWLRLRKGAVVPVAALLWSTLWVSIYYSYEAMPNQYVAYGALAATGWLVLALREATRTRYLVYVAISLAFTTLMRPSDSFFLLAALAGTVLVVRRVALRRRVVVLATMAAGLAAGLAQWIVEAYMRFGGPVARFHAASAENIGGVHWSLGAEMRTLAGPILCRAGCHAAAPLNARLWWFALVPLIVIGLVVAHRQQVSTMYVITTAAALAIAAEYVVTIGYSAPRFLEPTYALLALPIAEGVVWLGRHPAPVWRPVAIAAVAIVALAQLNNQIHIVEKVNHAEAIKADRDRAIATSLKSSGVRGQCSISGVNAAMIAFMDHCNDNPLSPRYVHTDNGLQVVAMAVVERQAPAGATYYSRWPEYSIRGPNVPGQWRVWLSPHRSSGAAKHG
jgi:hypothetical protein